MFVWLLTDFKDQNLGLLLSQHSSGDISQKHSEKCWTDINIAKIIIILGNTSSLSRRWSTGTGTHWGCGVSLEISKRHLDVVLCTLLWVPEHWARWTQSSRQPQQFPKVNSWFYARTSSPLVNTIPMKSLSENIYFLIILSYNSFTTICQVNWLIRH